MSCNQSEDEWQGQGGGCGECAGKPVHTSKESDPAAVNVQRAGRVGRADEQAGPRLLVTDPGGRVNGNKHFNHVQSMTYLQGECSYIRANSVY